MASLGRGTDDRATTRRPLALLLGGAAVGVLLAAIGLSVPRPEGLPAGVVAMVDGEPIRADDYARLCDALVADARTVPSEADRQRVLDRLIDEELLVQRGLALGLARHDRRLRGELIQTVIDGVVSQAGDRDPSDAELGEFYAANRDFFASPGRLRVHQVFVPTAAPVDAAALAQAQRAAERVRGGEAIEAVQAELGSPPLAPVPDALLPPAKLRDYLGPTALRAALALAPGAVSDPLRSGTGYHVLQVTERQADALPALAEIRTQVLEELRRRAGERALRAYLDELRRDADIAIAEHLP